MSAAVQPEPETPAEPSVAMTVPKHGGGRLRRGNPNNSGGAGRPPSILRQQLAGSFAERVKVAEDIADGKPQLVLVAKEVKVKDRKTGKMKTKWQQQRLKQTPSNADRLRALDLLAKYGIGAAQDVRLEEVRDRLERTLTVLKVLVEPERYEAIVRELEPIWSGT